MLVSVIMPTYNCGAFIEESVKSVLMQTVADWELIIVDDCSTDHTLDVLKPYLEKHPNIHYHCLEKNGGPAVARTEAMRLAAGKYMAFLDSDDLWSPDKLEKQIAFMKKTGAVFTCTGYRQMDEDGNDLGVVCVPPLRTDYNAMLYRSNPIGNLTVMYDVEALGRYTVPPIRKRNDFALWLKILRDAECCVGMPDVLGQYRIRKNSVSSNKLSLAKFHWQLYREIEKLPLWKAALAMLSWAFLKAFGIGTGKKKG